MPESALYGPIALALDSSFCMRSCSFLLFQLPGTVIVCSAHLGHDHRKPWQTVAWRMTKDLSLSMIVPVYFLYFSPTILHLLHSSRWRGKHTSATTVADRPWHQTWVLFFFGFAFTYVPSNPNINKVDFSKQARNTRETTVGNHGLSILSTFPIRTLSNKP